LPQFEPVTLQFYAVYTSAKFGSRQQYQLLKFIYVNVTAVRT